MPQPQAQGVALQGRLTDLEGDVALPGQPIQLARLQGQRLLVALMK